MSELKYKRVLLKLSGEALAGETKFGVNEITIGKICDKIKELVDLNAEVAIVVGGGNFWRGKNGHEMERTTSDYMGMLATCMNGLALQDALESRGVPARLQTAVEMRTIAEQYIKRKADKHLANGRVVIFSGGTGSPFFTTDTAAALRAAEIEADAILVGNKEEITLIAKNIGMDLNKFEIVNIEDPKKAALHAVELVSTGRADMLMKGLLDTATFLRSVLNKEVGLRTGKLMSHVAVFEIEGIDRLILLTDAAFNTYPELKDKAQIIRNSVVVAKACGISTPKVAPICAVEVVNENMQATVDAALLSKMSDRGQIKGCIVDGPLALDNALSIEAAEHKGISGPVAGNADILLLPNIETANVMYKTLTYTANTKNGGILVGTSAPVILTSRADSFETKVNSIALAALVAENK